MTLPTYINWPTTAELTTEARSLPRRSAEGRIGEVRHHPGRCAPGGARAKAAAQRTNNRTPYITGPPHTDRRHFIISRLIQAGLIDGSTHKNGDAAHGPTRYKNCSLLIDDLGTINIDNDDFNS